MKKPFKLMIGNTKGGCGKTTLAVNLSYYFAENKGQKVLLLDLDTQGQSGEALGIDPGFEMDVLITGNTPVSELIIKSEQSERLHIIRSQHTMWKRIERFAFDVFTGEIKYNLFKERLSQVEHKYDLIVFDTPAHTSTFVIHAIEYVDKILVPLEIKYLNYQAVEYSLKGMLQEQRAEDKLLGYVPVKFNLAHSETKKIYKDFIMENKDKIAPPIRTCAYLSKAAFEGKPILTFAKNSNGAKDITAVGEWVREKITGVKKR